MIVKGKVDVMAWHGGLNAVISTVCRLGRGVRIIKGWSEELHPSSQLVLFSSVLPYSHGLLAFSSIFHVQPNNAKDPKGKDSVKLTMKSP